MIPTAILLGLVAGLTRFRWWSIPVIGVIWVIILLGGGNPSVSAPQLVVGGFVFGALNGAAGVLATWGWVHVLSKLLRWMRGMWRTG